MLRMPCFALLGAIAIVGCSKGPSVQTYPVTGTVTYNGKPVAGATVIYATGKDADAQRSTGITDEGGKFSLNTFISSKELLRGAVPGEYKVAIIKLTATAQQAAASGGVDWQSMSADERGKQMTQMWDRQKDPSKEQKEAAPKSEIPERYAVTETSGLTAAVVVGENEPREFKLTDN